MRSSSMLLRSFGVASLLCVTGCAYSYTSNDAGDGAWVEQVVPALLGRKPINAMESRVLVNLIQQKGRGAAVDVLMSTPEFESYWSIVLADMVKLQRDGTVAQNASCWNNVSTFWNQAANKTALATALSTQNDPTQAISPNTTFYMGDVLRSAIAKDDLFGVWRAQLFSLGHQGRHFPGEARDVFLGGFTNRKPLCLNCHTSSGSTTAISPIAMNLDGSLFPSGNPYDAADRVHIAFAEQSSPTADSKVLGAMAPSCGTILQSSLPDAHNASGTDFAGLSPWITCGWPSGGSTCESFDVRDLDESLMLGHAQLTGNDFATNLTTAITPGYGFSYGAPGGDKAFAAAVALSTTEAIVKELEGHGLTLVHGHPRVDEQRSYLQSYTYLFVNSGWSLRYLLRWLVLTGTFNMRAPSQSPSAYPFPMFFNPWAKNAVGPAQDVNGPGDLVHRFSVPGLLTSIHHSLGWAAPKVSPTGTYPTKTFQRDLGRHESFFQSGMDDVFFQSLLTWEETVGMCKNPGSGTDWIDAVITSINASSTPVTLKDVVIAFKDRFIQDQNIQENIIVVDPDDDVAVGNPADPDIGVNVDWEDANAITEWAEQESELSDQRAAERAKARQLTDQVAAEREIALAKWADADALAAEQGPPPADAWRGRFDAFTKKRNDAEWSKKWAQNRDHVSHPEAVVMLDKFGVEKSWWTIQLPASEAERLATYFGVSSLNFPANLIANLGDKLRGYCGTLVTTPQFMLGGMRPLQNAADPIPNLLVCLPTQTAYCNENQLCTMYAGYAAAHGHGAVTCPP